MDEKATPHAQAPRPRFGSKADFETSRLTKIFIDSHTTIIRGLALLAPKQRRARVRWIIAAGLLAVIGVLAAGRSTREFAMSKAGDFYRARRARIAAAEPAPAPAPTLEPTPAASGVASAVSVQAPAIVVADQAAEPTPATGEAASAAAAPTGGRAPKTRGAKRPRVPASRGGT